MSLTFFTYLEEKKSLMNLGLLQSVWKLAQYFSNVLLHINAMAIFFFLQNMRMRLFLIALWWHYICFWCSIHWDKVVLFCCLCCKDICEFQYMIYHQSNRTWLVHLMGWQMRKNFCHRCVSTRGKSIFEMQSKMLL